MSNHEYPFSAKWTVSKVVATDITSVDFVVKKWNKSTNVYDTLSSGTIGSADVSGAWIAPYTISDSSDLESYKCVFTPSPGPPTHPIITDYLEQITTPDTTGSSGPIDGCGSETHSGTVCDPDGNPLSGATVIASPYGTTYMFATATTDINGEYTISGLYLNHSYTISYNKDGYWGRISTPVIA